MLFGWKIDGHEIKYRLLYLIAISRFDSPVYRHLCMSLIRCAVLRVRYSQRIVVIIEHVHVGIGGNRREYEDNMHAWCLHTSASCTVIYYNYSL